MTPTSKLVEMIEQLPAEDRLHLEQYIAYLNARLTPPTDPEERKYYEYILEGLREGEASYARGEALDLPEAEAYLASLLKKK